MAYLKIANDLAEEFCIEESSDGVNFSSALFPSNDDVRLTSSSVAGISGGAVTISHDKKCTALNLC